MWRLSATAAVSAGERSSPTGTGPFRVKTLEFPRLRDEVRGRPVPLKVHFPAEGAGFPLVVISHGGMGSWDSHLYQALHLASHGYVVVCIRHVYSDNVRVAYYMSRAGGRMSLRDALHRITTDPKAVLERPRDVSFAIDQAARWNEEDPDLRGKADLKRVAVVGHSFGAYTALAVCGARPVLDYLDPPVFPGKGLAGDLSDERVVFGLAMSPQPPGSTFFGEDGYRTVDRPVVVLSGSKDDWKTFNNRIAPAEGRRRVWELLPRGEKYFLWLDGADHLSFADHPRAWMLPSASRRDVQRISKAAMVLFCDYYLKEDGAAARRLDGEYFNSLCGWVVKKVEWRRK